jgi:thiosulfate dehydrogenase [quinone] large subunit
MPKTVLGWLEAAVVVIAGLYTLVHIILGEAHPIPDDGWGWALLVLFVIAVILAFVRYAGERSSLAPRTDEAFPEPSISRFFLGSGSSAPMWFVLRMDVGATWLSAGLEKIMSPAWGTSGTAMKGFVSGALKGTSGANPAVQGWYAWFLQHVVLNAPGLFSFAITWGEFLVGLGILLGVLTGIAAAFGVLMNFNYMLAGTVSINPILGMFGIFLVLSWRVCGWIGGDRWLLPALGLPWKPGAAFQGSQRPRVASP